MPNDRAPGVYFEDVQRVPAAELLTGVPVFLGLTEKWPEEADEPDSLALTRWPEFEIKFGRPVSEGFLAPAVRGFFQNGGRLCYVRPLQDVTPEALETGLARMACLDDVDLVCAPDIATEPRPELQVKLQETLLNHCDERGDLFAVLDLDRRVLESQWKNEGEDDVPPLRGANGAVYYPWVRTSQDLVPPCGHVAGVYARSDRGVGVHKAPANEVLDGVLDLEVALSDAEQAELLPLGINCLRAFPGRGIRIWGARTLSDHPAWTYVNVRRLFLTAGRRIERHLAGVPFEPNDPRLWSRIERELTVFFNEMFERGALRGATAAEAFFVKCDADLNPDEVRDRGIVVTEVGLAPGIPSEFVVVRIIHDVSGVTIAEPTRSS